MKDISDYFNIQRIVKRRCMAILLTLVFITMNIPIQYNIAQASGYSLVALSCYHRTLKIGQSFYLVGVATNAKRVIWKSSRSSIASVNTYGKVTAKKAGTCKITGKVSGGEASCTVTVERTKITLSATNITMENGTTTSLSASTSNGSSVMWKSQKSSVASIDERGKLRAMKPGETTITAKADGSTGVCRVTVKKPKIQLENRQVTLYRRQSILLDVKVSSGRKVTWKSNKKSVAQVNEAGTVTAMKHGTAVITASVDGVTSECQVTVKPPVIRLNKTSVSLKKGKMLNLTVSVTSGNDVTWKSSKSSVASVSSKGKIKARKKGTCYIYASEDGARESCHVRVTV